MKLYTTSLSILYFLCEAVKTFSAILEYFLCEAVHNFCPLFYISFAKQGYLVTGGLYPGIPLHTWYILPWSGLHEMYI